MNTLKRKKIVMLPTQEADNCLYTSSGRLNYHRGYLTQDYLKNYLNGSSYHLYFLSDEKIEEGDWIFYLGNNHNVDKIQNFGVDGFVTPKNSKKIIATTNRSLYNNLDSLPQPSSNFIKVFIESYNGDNIIDEVDVEYEVHAEKEGNKYPIQSNEDLQFYMKECYDIVDVLKTNSRDNTITTRKVKNTYTQEEVDELLDRERAMATAQVLEKFKGCLTRDEVEILLRKLLNQYFIDFTRSVGLNGWDEFEKFIQDNLG